MIHFRQRQFHYYSLQIPSDTEKMRNFFFEMPVPFCIREEVYERYWPMVDNIWALKSTEAAPAVSAGNSSIPYDIVRCTGNGPVPCDTCRYVCRFARKPAESKGADGQKPARKKARREGATCNCRVKTFHYHGVPGIPNHYQFERGNAKESDWSHTHTMDECDSEKINSFLRDASMLEVAKGHSPG
jgi:hypothetical protein